MGKNKQFIITEGPTDRDVMKAVFKQVGLDTEKFEFLPEKDTSEFGRDNAISWFIDLSGWESRAILLLDFDDHDMEGLNQEVRERAMEKGVEIDTSRIIGIGMKGDPGIEDQWGIDRFAMDDYVFKLLIDPEAFQNLQKHEKRLKKVDHRKIINKIKTIKNLFQDNEIPIHTTKRYIPLIESITGWVLGSGTLYQRVVECAPKGRIVSLWGKVIDAVKSTQ